MNEDEAKALVQYIVDWLPWNGLDGDALQQFIEENNLEGKAHKFRLLSGMAWAVSRALMFGHDYGTPGYPRLPYDRTFYCATNIGEAFGDNYKVTFRVFVEEGSDDVLVVEAVPHQYGSPLVGCERQLARFHVKRDGLPGFVFEKKEPKE